jgi:hypothetical protein
MSNEENIQTEIPLVVEVKEGALGALVISTNSHNALADREIANQHSIDAIRGLREKLITLQQPDDTKSVKGRGYAEYHAWLNGAPSSDKKGYVGYFVSLVQVSNNLYITPVSAEHPDIFGVIISKANAAFVANDEWTEVKDEITKVVTDYTSNRDESYGLVCLEGSVKVRYANNAGTLDIEPGDWVKPTGDGRADKATSANGCYLVAGAGIDTDGYYVEINLSLSATDVKQISVNHAKEADNYTSSGTIKSKMDELDQKIDTEVVNLTDDIQNGDVIAKIAKDFDTAGGTIKTEFDAIKTEFDAIKDGTTIVKKAEHAASAKDYTNDGAIKEKFDDVEKSISDIENGTRPVAKAIGDTNGKAVDRNYYYLHSIDDDDDRYINSEKYASFDINTLSKPSDCGVYLIHWNMIKNRLISGLPNDNAFPTEGATVKLIVESSGNQGADDTFSTVYHTLKIRTGETSQNAHLLMYHRVVVGATWDNKPIWSNWQRFVSAEECDNRYARPMSKPQITNGKYEFNVGTVLTWAYPAGELADSFIQQGLSLNNFTIYRTELAPFLISKGVTNVAGEWVICGPTGNALFVEFNDAGEVDDYDKLISYQLYMVQRVK